MGSLSRVQLAAALIEYDNDSPYTTERKFAKESAIMSSVKMEESRREKPVRRDWTKEREQQARRDQEEQEQEEEEEEERERELRTQQESLAPPVGDFRRSSSPFLQNLHESQPPPPNRASTSTPPPPPPRPSSPGTTPRQVQVSQPRIIKPKPLSSQRNVSISGVLADMMDVEPVVASSTPPKAHVPPRPHSTQPLNSSSSLLDPLPMTIPPQGRPLPRSGSSNSLASSSSMYASAPIALFNVPSFDLGPASASSSTKAAPSKPKRRLSALLLSSKPKTPSPLAPQPPAEPIRPLSETLRESIAALPRSLGGEGPSHRTFGGRGRTASMGDWESLVLAHGGEAEGGGGEFGGYAQRVRDVWEKPSQVKVEQPRVETRAQLAGGEEDDGTVEFEGVYGIRPPAPVVQPQPSRRLSVVPSPQQQQDSPELEEVQDQEELDERRRTTGATPESSWGRASYDDGSRRPSSGYSFIDRVPLDDGEGDLDLPPMFRHNESGSGSNTPRSTAGDYNDRAIPFPSSSSNSRPLSPSTPFRRLDLELGDEERDHGPDGGRRTPGGSLWDEIGRTTPDLLSRNDQGGGDVDAAVARGGASRQSFRRSRFDENYDEQDDDNDEEEELVEEERWVPPPSKGRASRFDPKSQSISSRSGMTPVPPGGSDYGDEEDQRRASIEQQASDTGRRLPGKRGNPKVKARPTSLAHFGQTHRLSTTPTSSIFLPPVLVMPAPLDPSGGHHPAPRSRSNSTTRGGFVQTDSIPLPASFSTRPPLVHSKSSSSFVAAAAALGVPQKRLSLAQKTFRASLVVDGKRGGEFMGGALEEGQRGWELDEDAGLESVVGAVAAGRGEDEYRGPGSLYGRSLMEVLEERKLALKSKQRVFAGDSRPAMFTRTKSSGSFNSQRPNSMAGSIHLNPTLPGGRPLSSTSPNSLHEILNDDFNPARPNTLLNPGDETNSRPGMPKKRNSVFGIDELWEKETRQREAEEREEAERVEKRQEEERLKLSLEEEKKRLKAEKKQGKRRSRLSFVLSPGGSSSLLSPTSPNGIISSQLAVDTPLPTSPSDIRISALPPTLALLEHSPSKPMSQILRRPEDDSDSDWEAREEERGGDDLGLGQARRRSKKGRTSGAGGGKEGDGGRRTSGGLGIGTWFASSDEDDGGEDDGTPRRRRPSPQPPVVAKPADDSSDDEVPLAAQYNLPSSRSFISVTKPPPSDDSEEERPLAQILKEKRDRQASSAPTTLRSSNSTHQPSTSLTTTTNNNDEDEDDVPLGLRTSSYQHQHPNNGEGDDDLPLGLTQAQHLQQIYMAQQHQMAMMQQQQQQMQMHEFQVRQSMMMGGGGMLGMNGMGMGGMGGGGFQMPPPQGPRAEEKVDRWRRGVAGES
ncbi:hypothetical protein BDY24DRAFT_416497 [Mrakia frigida]|uniref:uncharacterized protein n=1 Tax=Mrakia frigida TaxID=29902 RepID=UPI003FCC086C